MIKIKITTWAIVIFNSSLWITIAMNRKVEKFIRTIPTGK